MEESIVRRWIGPAVVLGMLALSLAVYGRLPERMPTHWNLTGQPDGWSPRFWGAFLMPLLAAGMLTFMTLLRRSDRRRVANASFDATSRIVMIVLLVFLALLHALVLLAALGMSVDMTRTVLFMIGLLFIALGQAMPRLEPNRWIGVRTPWTLRSDRVWRRTHRLARYSFIASGLITMLAAVLPPPVGLPLGIAALLAGALIPVPYSWLVYRRGAAEP